MNIPIIINNFNRLSTTRKLTEDLQTLGYTNIHILDNGSSYQPLLQWYNQQGKAKVFMLHRNYGARALYDSGHISSIVSPWYVYTDSDIELNGDTPKGFIEYLISVAERYNSTKIGLSLRIDDIKPEHYGYQYVGWEKKFWENEIEPGVYDAQIDTTFAVIKNEHPFVFRYEALRVAGNFTARHIPWYSRFDHLDEEELYFLHASSLVSTYKRHYRNFTSGS